MPLLIDLEDLEHACQPLIGVVLQEGEWIGLPVAIPLQLKLACLWNDLQILFVRGRANASNLARHWECGEIELVRLVAS